MVETPPYQLYWMLWLISQALTKYRPQGMKHTIADSVLAYVYTKRRNNLPHTRTESAESYPKLCQLGVNPPIWMTRIAQRFVIDMCISQLFK